MSTTLDPALLATLVTVGIGLIVALTHLTGGSVGIRLDDDRIRDSIGLDVPEDPVVDITISDDRLGALTILASGGLGVAFAMGDHVVVRRVGPGVLASVGVTASGLQLTWVDAGLPRLRLPLADPDLRRGWADRLQSAGAP